MLRSVEEKEVRLAGEFRVEQGRPVEVLVLPDKRSGSIPQEPFRVRTASIVQRVEAKGVLLQGGILLPWECLTKVGRSVIVKRVRDEQGLLHSIMDLGSLLGIKRR